MQLKATYEIPFLIWRWRKTIQVYHKTFRDP
jgi:hypothetical protein